MEGKIKCPLCHTMNTVPLGRCICGFYYDTVKEDTWKDPKYLEMHEKWEAGEMGYNLIYHRLAELEKKFPRDDQK